MSTENKNEQFTKILRERLEKYVLEYSKGKPFDEAPNTARGRAFTEFYVRDILSHLESVDEDDIELGLQCDGGRDLNVDCALQSDGTFHIFQSKFKGSKTRLTNDEISGFFSIHQRLLDRGYLEEQANKYLLQATEKFNHQSEVKYFFITSAQLSEHDDLRKEFQRQQDVHSQSLKNPENVSWELISFTELRHHYDRAQGIEVETPATVDIPLENIGGNTTWAYLDLTPIVDHAYPSFICTIKGTVLKSIFEAHRTEIFNWNIRQYLGQNPVNKQITKTISESPEQFYYFNNGISAICTNLEVCQGSSPNSKVLRCKDFQIINGAQTAMCIARFRDANQLGQVRILLRVTKTEDIRKASKGLNRRIIACNNSQTVIKPSDFKSNDDIQLFLEKELNGKTYHGESPFKTLHYLRKRQEPLQSRNEKVINMETLAKAIHSFRYSPLDFLKKANCLYDSDVQNDGRYNYVFGEEGNEVDRFTNERTNEICAITFIWFKLDEILHQKKDSLKAAGRAESFEFLSYLPKWHYLWAYGELLRTLHKEKMTNVYQRLIDGRAFKVNDPFVVYWFDPIAHEIRDCITDAYEAESDDIKSKKGFNYKNWIRNDKAFEKIKRKFANPLERNYPCNV